MGWNIFYYACAALYCAGLTAMNFFGWHPTPDRMASAALFAGMVACHSMGRQKL